jgi:ABC-type Fe3+/spermidine/putrescine transport system ATPase subunit
MSDLRLDRLVKRYGPVTAVDHVSLAVPEGRFLSLVGPSGCGKTTVLRMVAGLVDPDGGGIFVGGQEITAVPVHRRNLGLVFQSYALFPHMTVFENVAFGLHRRGVAKAELETRVRRALAMVRLEGLAGRAPKQLSGGQQQRTALARALVVEPRLLLLDEPFSNLDALLRDEMRYEIKRLQQEIGITTLFVTHDQAEALGMADLVVVMNAGRIEQVDAPKALYARPASAFVAHFIGRANLLPGRIARGAPGFALDGGPSLPIAEALPEGRYNLVLRQEHLRLAAGHGGDGSIGLPGTVIVASFTGAASGYLVRLDLGREIQVSVAGERASHAPGAKVVVAWNPADAVLVPAEARP